MMDKSEAERLLNLLYQDCYYHSEWDKEDEDNWSSMRDNIEKLAEYFDVNIQTIGDKTE